MGYSNDVGPVRPSGRLIGCAIFAILFVVATIGAFTWNSWGPPLVAKMNQPQAQTPVNNTPVQPGQTNVEPTNSSPTVPTGARQKLVACIVNFGPYFPVILIPNDNPAYDLEIVPLNFYETADQLAAGQFINSANESEQIGKLTDGTCDLLFTTLDVLSKHPGMGKLIAIIGQSDGADKSVAWNVGVSPQCLGKPINIFNDLVGCRLAVAEDSVGYYQALSFLKLANISVDQVNIDTYPTPDDAVAACLAHKDDFCSGWVPTIDDMIIDGKTKVMLNSNFLKTIYDGIFASNNALQTKHEALQAFEKDWFRAVKMTQDDLPGAADKIQKWTYNGMNTNEYTFVYEGTATDDLNAWFETYAQASFDSHFVFQANPDVLYEILKTGRDVWAWSQLVLDDGFDPKNMVDLSFFTKLSGDTSLNSKNGFVNNTFSPFPEQSDQPVTREQLIALPTLVEIVCPNVFFGAGKVTIQNGTPEYDALVTCGDQIKTLMNQSNVDILIIGSAAWPDPAVFGEQYKHCGDGTDLDYCTNIAKGRASFALTTLTGYPLFLPGQRFAIDIRLGDKTSLQSVLHDNRFVTIQVKVGGLE